MWNAPIIEERHHIREAHAARFNNDLPLMADALKELEQEWLPKFPQKCDHFLPKQIAGETKVQEVEEIAEEVL